MDPEANAKAPMLSGNGVQTTVRLSAADQTVPQRVSANSPPPPQDGDLTASPFFQNSKLLYLFLFCPDCTVVTAVDMVQDECTARPDGRRSRAGHPARLSGPSHHLLRRHDHADFFPW